MLRLQSFLDQLAQNHDETDKILIMTHGGVIRALLSLVAGISAQEDLFICIDNTSLSLMGLVGSRRHIRFVNRTEHLTGDLYHCEGVPM